MTIMMVIIVFQLTNKKHKILKPLQSDNQLLRNWKFVNLIKLREITEILSSQANIHSNSAINFVSE